MPNLYNCIYIIVLYFHTCIRWCAYKRKYIREMKICIAFDAKWRRKKCCLLRCCRIESNNKKHNGVILTVTNQQTCLGQTENLKGTREINSTFHRVKIFFRFWGLRLESSPRPCTGPLPLESFDSLRFGKFRDPATCTLRAVNS